MGERLRMSLDGADGITQYQVARCRVDSHVGTLGVQVSIVSPACGGPAFINARFPGTGSKAPPREFPAIGSCVDAVVLSRKDGECRLTAQPSALDRIRVPPPGARTPS
ncbi:hypothetical protein ACIQWN_32575 [Streptomyces vinaceus]|uniref:hypothetical protein n=1 Tax=Streptomyces vinaceus TaxID=1960 RepID=UPI003816674A